MFESNIKLWELVYIPFTLFFSDFFFPLHFMGFFINSEVAMSKLNISLTERPIGAGSCDCFHSCFINHS